MTSLLRRSPATLLRCGVIALAFVLSAASVSAQSPASDHGARSAATPSTSFIVTGAVNSPKTFSLEDLRREPVTTEQVYFSTGRGVVKASFTGVLLWTLLQTADIKTDPNARNDILHHVVVVSADDGYSVTLSAGELDPEFGAEPAIVAYAQDGKPLGDGGFARLILPGDKGGGRNIMRISRIEIR